jgi:hypothetical protein
MLRDTSSSADLKAIPFIHSGKGNDTHLPLTACNSPNPVNPSNTLINWPDCSAAYRMRLFSRAGNVHQSGKVILSQEKIREILKNGGKLTSAEVFRVKLRHMSDGVALGTKDFVENVFNQFRERFSTQRKDGARPIRFLGDSGLHTLRDLQVRVLG